MPHVCWVPRVEGEDEIVVAVTAVVEQFLGASGRGWVSSTTQSG